MIDLLHPEVMGDSPGKGRLLYGEFPVPSDTGPYIITGKGSLFLWVGGSRQILRSAFRYSLTKEYIYASFVEEIIEANERMGWGSCHPLNEDGLESAYGYLRYYGIDEVDLIVPLDQYEKALKWAGESGVEVFEVGWCPEDTWVFVPKDRSLLGVLVITSDNSYSVIAHNPSRGISICRAPDKEALSDGVAEKSLQKTRAVEGSPVLCDESGG